MNWTTLVGASDLHAALGRRDLVVLDARVSLADRGLGLALHRAAHLPGALYADLERDLSDANATGQGRHPWPRITDFLAALERWGVWKHSQVVVYDANDGALAASRVWFLLRALGHARVAVLDGGFAQWSALGLPVEPGVVTARPSTYDACFDRSRLLDSQAVQRHLDQGGLLVDARAGERFRGEVEPLDPVAGHVPGAVNRPYALNMRDGRFKSADELAGEFGRLLAGRPPADVVAMCGSGVTACHHLLALEHAGLHGAKLFTGSWSRWIADGTRPVTTGG